MRIRKSGILKQGVSLGLVVVLIVQAVALVRVPSVAQAAESPTGPLKRVIVEYRGNPVLNTSAVDVEGQVKELAQRRDWLEAQLKQASGYKKVIQQMSQLPYVIMKVDEAGERSLRDNPNVVSVQEDRFLSTPMMNAIPLIGGSVASGFSDGTTDFTGNDKIVAVIDTGVDGSHTLLNGAVVSEACYSLPSETYSDAIIESGCIGGGESSTATGSAAPCDVNIDTSCTHGTSVAGAALMRSGSATIDRDGSGPGASETVNLSGVATDAKLLAIKTVVKITEISGQPDLCGDAGNQTQSCFRPSVALALLGLNRALELQNAHTLSGDIVSVNVSLGSTVHYFSDTSQCEAADTQVYGPFNQAAQSLKVANIATIVAAGNEGEGVNQNKLGAPACLSNVIGVSASTKTNQMASYSNAGPLTALVAPGGDYSGSGDPYAQMLLLPEPSNTLGLTAGTSFAAPIVAGSWAVLREKAPTASVDTLLQTLKNTGVTIAENRSGYTVMNHKRIKLDSALAQAASLPSIGTITAPSGQVTGGSTVSVPIEVANATSCQVYSGSTSVATVTLSGGQGTATFQAPNTNGNATYRVECVGANSTMAQNTFTFAVTANTDAPQETPGVDDSESAFIPGVPNTGIQTRIRIAVSMAFCLALLLILQRNLLFRSGSRAR